MTKPYVLRLLFWLLAGPLLRSPLAAQNFDVRVTVRSGQSVREGYGYTVYLSGYVDGTAARLRCSGCRLLNPGTYWGRWNKDNLVIQSQETFGKHKLREEKFEVSLRGPKRDTSWHTKKTVLITTYGTSEEKCRLPKLLAQNVIYNIDHPADWRIILTCTPHSWENANLAFHNLGGTRIAFTQWDNGQIPSGGVVMTVLNGEQFDHCMRPGCYVHTVLHELGHYRYATENEARADAYASERELTLFREHPATGFPSIQELKKQCEDLKKSARRVISCKVTSDLKVVAGTKEPEAQPEREAKGKPETEKNAAEVGTVVVDSVPEGAEVYIDGNLVGGTPATFRLAAGKHTIRVALKNYKDWSRELSVLASSEVKLTATLEKRN
jgi:hypothetical protein